MASFFVSIWLGKGICYCKHYEKLSGKLFAEFIEDNFFEVLKVAVTLQGMCLFKMVIQVKTPKLLKLLQTRSVLYHSVYPLAVRILILMKMFSI